MSSPLAGALMMTFLAPASMCAAAFVGVGEDAGALERRCRRPRSPHGRSAGSFSARILISRPSMMIDESPALDLAVVRAVRRVVLEQQGVHLGVDEVVDGDDLDVRGALDERLERLAADAAEAVDADAGGHGGVLLACARLAPGALVTVAAPSYAVARARRERMRSRLRPTAADRHAGHDESPRRAGRGFELRPKVALLSRRSGRPCRRTRAGALVAGLPFFMVICYRILDFDLLLVLDAIGLGHRGSSSIHPMRRGNPSSRIRVAVACYVWLPERRPPALRRCVTLLVDPSRPGRAGSPARSRRRPPRRRPSVVTDELRRSSGWHRPHRRRRRGSARGTRGRAGPTPPSRSS